MDIIFKNNSADVAAMISFSSEDGFVLIPPLKEYVLQTESDILDFSVKYEKDFSFGYKYIPKNDGDIRDIVTERLAQKAVDSIGNLVIRAINTYRIACLRENAVILLDDRAHYISAGGLEAFLGCFPAVLYFGQAESTDADISLILSHCLNRAEFISLYKFIYRTINLHGFIFNFLKYKIQLDRQRKISTARFLTERFSYLYSLTCDERDYQFKPVTVLTDKFIKFVKGKLPKRIYNKLVRKLKRYFNI